ncbi:unnamed protein product [Polarella glacialis]|uniref:Uncharacterized protein n=1 Tax=Polarella glacialis TaxID=89957 RepID=A0A813JHN4_POLGL|nr:unnamed protein product [Polarella glacialis]
MQPLFRKSTKNISCTKLLHWISFAKGCIRCVFELPASKFRHILESADGATSSTYLGNKLSQISPQRRGAILESVSRAVYAEAFPAAIVCDAAPGLDVIGRRRSPGQADYDWLCDGSRVECKSGQLVWQDSSQSWLVSFFNIKLDSLDDLILTMYTPNKLHVIRHDLKLGLSTVGVRGRHMIRLHGRRSNTRWEDAATTILDKLSSPGNRCQILAELDNNNDKVIDAIKANSTKASVLTESAFRGVPLTSMISSRRALRIQMIVQEVDRIMHPFSTVTATEYGAKFDWWRDDIRVECKYAQLLWNKTLRTWRCLFSGIKFAFPGVRSSAHFDDLLLAMYSPRGIDIFRHTNEFGLSTTGSFTAHRGLDIVVSGPRHQEDVLLALEVATAKLEAGGCKRLATVHW